ncbi:PDZ domain-containing protein [Leeia aquatica]|uniref:PDZ domain-containing protein n=1 Tax=Leeia aquatica TaxID=2725557 RepID=A0A847SA43_9NEIS|nr:PDZ domain-containing protein [Leeia aquatica]NLR76603.1 PDZ domain-containing protein [Leeia aquatica]
MKKWLLALSLVLLSSMQCATATDIYVRKDDFTGEKHFFSQSSSPDLVGGSFWTRRYVDVSLHMELPVKNKHAPYWIRFDMRTPRWVLVTEGESLALKLDGGEIIRVSGPGGLKSLEIVDNETASESATFRLTPALLRKMATAGKVEFRLTGEEQSITGTLTDEQLFDLSMFDAHGAEMLGMQVPPKEVPPPSSYTSTILGLSVASLSAEQSSLKGDPGYGVMVTDVVKDSFAAKAQIQPGDVLKYANGVFLYHAEDLQKATPNNQAGPVLAVVYTRKGEKKLFRLQIN